jgi:hypothetical protein
MKVDNMHEDLSQQQIEEIMSNVDNPLRHNIGGNMNRPVRNADPLSPRNVPHRESKNTNFEFEAKVMNVLDGVYDMLMSKNEKYGNSALEPIRIFSSTDSVEQIKVRLDDKLSRIKQSSSDEDEDVIKDILGYLVLLEIANGK